MGAGFLAQADHSGAPILSLQASFSLARIISGVKSMTKEELMAEILKYVVPIQPHQLKSYSQERLEDYLGHLQAMGRRRATAELATAEVASSQGQSH